MSWLTVTKLMARAWRWIAGSRIAQALFAAGAFLAWLKWQMVSAKREGRDDERNEARERAHQHRAEHEGDIHSARQAKREDQKERRERERDEDPRDRFGRDPWQ